MSHGATRSLRFNILGPIEGWADGERLRLGGVIQERILATLLLEPGRVLPVSRLVEAAWADDPPPTASHQVRKAVADLRRRIPDGAEVLLTDGPGYRVVVDDAQLDLAEFTELSRSAKALTAAGRRPEAADALRGALALWRGPLLSGSGGTVLDAAAAILEERRLAAAEQLLELRLDLGESGELVGDLRELIAQHPLRESLRGHLMLALYRSGRQAEALEEFGRVRELLVEELGIDPGPQLTHLYEAILQESDALAAPQHAGPAVAAPVPIPVRAEPPCTLPADVADFTGRAGELGHMLDFARGGSEQGPLMLAVDGMGGVGKTTLAVHAAHLLVTDYPDGQLYVDLRGHTPGEQPVTVTAALDVLLRALGVPGEQIPEDLPGRTVLWRATLAGKRFLVLLDNAPDAANLQPLLPVTADSLVLVTSRARLVDLDGAHWVSVEIMPPEDSAALVSEVLGAERLDAEPDAAAELAQLCGHLPLALRIAAARLRNRPRWTVRYLVERLRDETRRLDELSSGARSVSATLHLSYQALEENSRRAFRMLALHPGGDISVHSAAALLGVRASDAEDVLELLLDVHLVQQPEMGLYRLHDLVRSFAQSLLGQSGADEDTAALTRLLGYYLAATEAACDLLFPGRRRRESGLPESQAELPDFREPQAARQWFAREQTAIVSAVTAAADNDLDRYAVCLARNLSFHLNERGQLEEYARLGRLAVASAQRLGDLQLLGVSLANLGVAYWKLGRFEEGVTVAEESLGIAARLGDQHTVAHSETTLGMLNSVLGRFPESQAHLEKAITLNRELDARLTEADALTILSTLHEQWGDYQAAREAALRAVELSMELGQLGTWLGALVDLAFAQLGLGDCAAAEASLAGARELCDETQDPGYVAMALILSAEVADRLGNHAGSDEYTARALELARTVASPLRRAKVENIAGRLRLRQGDPETSIELHRSAYSLACGINYRIEEAYAQAGLADALEHQDKEASASHRALAEALFARMGVSKKSRRG